MNEETIYLGEIKNVTTERTKDTGMKIMYRIKSINGYFFAEEISTGTIFPTFAIVEPPKNIVGECFNILSMSYLEYGKYFVFCALNTDEDKIGKYHFNVENHERIHKKPSVDEINAYLEKRKNDFYFKAEIEKYESENKFFCDINIIKTAINKDKINSNHKIDLIANYTTKIDLKSIESLGFDLSTNEKLCNCVGRERELKEVIKNVAIKNSSVLLIGEAGSGKTAIAEAIALEIKRGTNKWLENKTIISVSANSLVAGTRYRGEFEDNIKNLINFCKKNKGKVIIFIDEIHSLKGLGINESAELDGLNILKPYLSSRDITIIGATTKKGYQSLAEDDAFCRRFTKINIDLLPRETLVLALQNYIQELIKEYNIEFLYSEQESLIIIEKILDATDKCHQKLIGEPNVTNPTLSKNILEDAFVEAVYNEKESVSIEDIYNALINCDKLSPTIRKETSIRLKNSLESTLKVEGNVKEKTKILEFAK